MSYWMPNLPSWEDLRLQGVLNDPRYYQMKRRMIRGINGRLHGLYQYFHLIFGTTAFKPSQPIDTDFQSASVLFNILDERHKGVIEKQQLVHAHRALKQCSKFESLVQIMDDDGYNVLHKAVVSDDIDFLDMLVAEGFDMNIGKCSLPLHLACRLGKLQIVEFLLENGADLNIECGMCYPQAHVPVRHVPSRFHFLETDIFVCDSNHQLPLMYAILEDHIDVVKCLLEEGGVADSNWPYHRQPLHFAAKHGAYESLQYMTQLKPAELETVDEEGATPLLSSVRWGKKFVQYLVESNANTSVLTSKKKNALHLLYLNIVNPLEIYETTKFLLGTGLEQYVNAVDLKGNTALHELISLVNRRVTSFPKTLDVNEQAAFDSQVLDTIELLLNHNCDPNIVNGSGVTVLHKLILIFDFVVSNEPTGITMETVPTREMYKQDFDFLHRIMDMLLRHGSAANGATSAGRTPLVMLLQSILHVSPSQVPKTAEGFIRCGSMLCEYGAKPSSILPTHIAIVSIISKYGQKCLSQRTPETKHQMSLFLKDTLAMLLKYGLNSNHCSILKKKQVEGGSGNILIELVKLSHFIREPADFSLMQDWVVTSLQWGADPDIEPYPSEPIICHSQSSIYLKNKGTQPVNQYMYEIQDFTQIFDGGYAEHLLMLFYNSMDHDALFQCLATAKIMSRFDPHRSPSQSFITMVNNLSSKPRSLKQISRVAIYKGIDRKLNEKVKYLPLPNPLKQYLLNIQ